MSDAERASRALVVVRAIAGLVALLAVIVLVRLGLHHTLSESATRVRDELVSLGALGYLAFFLGYTFAQPFGLPGTALTFAAALVWPWPIAFALSFAASLTASSWGFAFARFVARDLVTRHLPRRFERWSERLTARAFSTVFLLRLAFLMSPILHAFFGVSRVRFRTHLLASALAYAGPVFLICYFGERALDYVEHAPALHMVVVAVIVVKIAVVSLLVRRHVRRRAAEKAAAHAAGILPQRG